MSERERLDWMRSLLEDGCLRGERCRSSTCRDEYPEEFAPRDAGGRLESRWCFVCRHREQLAAMLRASSAEPREPERVTDLEESAWGLIANANEGNWEAALPEWKDAAIRWREKYHAKLAAQREPEEAQSREARDRVSQVLELFYEVYGGAFDPCPDIGVWADRVLAAIRTAPADPEEPRR